MSQGALVFSRKKTVSSILMYFFPLAHVFLLGKLVVNAAGFIKKPKTELFQEAANSGLNMFCFGVLEIQRVV